MRGRKLVAPLGTKFDILIAFIGRFAYTMCLILRHTLHHMSQVRKSALDLVPFSNKLYACVMLVYISSAQMCHACVPFLHIFGGTAGYQIYNHVLHSARSTATFLQ